jgi:phosphoglycolate phosphatase-like HAD superfamily hydrolase
MKHFQAFQFYRVLLFFAALILAAQAHAEVNSLPSWNEGPAKQAIVDFVKATTTQGSPQFVPEAERIATFDQDGTLWVSHPIYSQVMYCLDRVPRVVKEKPKLANVEPFKTVMSGNREKIAKLSMDDLLKIVAATLTGMSVEEFQAEVKAWLSTARDPRWKRPYTELTYQPMQEVLKYLRDSGYKTYIVTGGGQDFVRVYSEATYGIPPEQVVGSALATKFEYDKSGKPFLIKEPKLLLNDNNAGKPEGIHLMIGRTLLSVTPPAMSRCLNTPSLVTALGYRCWCCTMTPSANMPMARRRVCPPRRSALSLKSFTTKRRNRVGQSSA